MLHERESSADLSPAKTARGSTRLRADPCLEFRRRDRAATELLPRTRRQVHYSSARFAYCMSNEEISFKCLSCGGDEVRVFYEARSVPVNSVLLISNRERALTFPTGDIRLGFCADCGFIF